MEIVIILLGIVISLGSSSSRYSDNNGTIVAIGILISLIGVMMWLIKQEEKDEDIL